jgi:hypothetical protein
LTLLEPNLRITLEAAKRHVALASPFIGASTILWLKELVARKNISWQLLTCLDPVAAAYGSLHLPGLQDLMSIRVEVRHLDNLHAKLFLTETSGFVGSANLTSAGLGNGHPANCELTVVLTPAQVTEAKRIYRRWYDAAEPVTPGMILECERRAAKLPARISKTPGQSSYSTGLADRADELLQLATGVDVWIKAIDSDDGGWGNGAWVSNSRPAQFSVGDLLVVYGKRQKACTAVLMVDKLAVKDPQRLRDAGYSDENANRWPWVSEVTSLLEFPESRRVPITELGKTPQSLQGGYCRMPVGGLAAALRYAL